ncbi:hypothetical protein [Nocardia sp. AG03]|uniref:hypothetical protein n=1 Tax=Nocardia sp. AG03 TaxID=3025312 RepID=UPI0024189487|nr:hypothetical protein [Nocardia sp. AG03]
MAQTTVSVEARDDYWVIAFSRRDDQLLDALKTAIPQRSRSYDRANVEWHIRVDVSGLLSTFERLDARVERLGEQAARDDVPGDVAHWKNKYDVMDTTARQQQVYIRQLEDEIEQLRTSVQRLRKESAERVGGSGDGGTWAEQLFGYLAASRTEAVFKALTKTFHPDNIKTGDTVLMQQLNDARDR